MYHPAYSLRVEVLPDAYDDLGDYRIILGGSQRGGVAISHGCFRHNPNELDAMIDSIATQVRDALVEYVGRSTAIQLRLT